MPTVIIECLPTRVKFITKPEDCDEVEVCTYDKGELYVEIDAGKVVYKSTETDEPIEGLTFLLTELISHNGIDVCDIWDQLDSCLRPPKQNTYIGLEDTNNSYAGAAGLVPHVNTNEDGLVFKTLNTGTFVFEVGSGANSVQLIVTSNNAVAQSSGVLSGEDNNSGSLGGFVAGGQVNSTGSDNYSFILGGVNNSNPFFGDQSFQSILNGVNMTGSDGQYNTFVNGDEQSGLVPGLYFGGSSNFFDAAIPFAQMNRSMDSSHFVLAELTTDATPTNLIINGDSGFRYVLEAPNNTIDAAITGMEVMVLGVDTSNGDTFWEYYSVGIKAIDVLAASFIGPSTPLASGNDVGAAAWNVSFQFNSVSIGLSTFPTVDIEVTGEVGKNIQWVALMEVTKTTFPTFS